MLALGLVAGCGEAAPAPAVSRLTCPEAWVPTLSGGCAPAVLRCAPERGAVDGCEGRWPVPPRTVTDPDGTMGVTLHTGPDGMLVGAWSWGRGTCPAGAGRDVDGACVWPAQLPLGALPVGQTSVSDEGRCGDEPVDDGATLFVSAAAAPGGDGRAARPFRSLTEALARGRSGARIFVRAGVYEGPVTLEGAPEVVGACAARVVLRAAGMTALVARGQGTAARVSGLRIESDTGAVSVTEGAGVEFVGVHLRGESAPTLQVDGGATVSVRGAILEGGAGGGVRDRDATVTLADVHLAATGSPALEATGRATRLALRNVALRTPGDYGIDAGEGATLDLAQVIVEGPHETGLRLDRATARAEHLVVRGVEGQVAEGFGVGAIVARYAARFDARELVVEDSGAQGLVARNEETSVRIEGATIRRVRPWRDTGVCVDVSASASVSLRAASVHHCVSAGIRVSEFARIDLRDAWVHNVAADARGLYGFGLGVYSFGGATARRVLIEDVATGGVGAIGVPEAIVVRTGFAPMLRARGPLATPLDLTDLIVRRTRPLPARPGFGLVLAAGAEARATRLAVDGAPGIAVAVTSIGYPGADLAAALVRSGSVPAAAERLLATIFGASLDGAATLAVDDLFITQGAPWTVGYDVNAPTSSPRIATSAGLYVGAASAARVRRATVDPGARGEYGLALLGNAEVTGLRVGPARRCALGTASGARITVDDGPPDGATRCSVEGIELVRLPVSAE